MQSIYSIGQCIPISHMSYKGQSMYYELPYTIIVKFVWDIIMASLAIIMAILFTIGTTAISFLQEIRIKILAQRYHIFKLYA